MRRRSVVLLLVSLVLFAAAAAWAAEHVTRIVGKDRLVLVGQMVCYASGGTSAKCALDSATGNLDLSGDLTPATLTMTGAVDVGAATVDTLDVEGAANVVGNLTVGPDGGPAVCTATAASGNLDCDGDATFGTLTMTGAVDVGDATVDSLTCEGTATVADLALTAPAAPAAVGYKGASWVWGKLDCTPSGGNVCTAGLSPVSLGVTFPPNSLIPRCYYWVTTTFTDGGDDDATVALSIGSTDIVTAAAITGGAWTDTDTVVGTVPDGSLANAINVTGASDALTATFAVDEVSAGVLWVACESLPFP